MLATLLLLMVQASPTDEMAKLLPTLQAEQEKFVKDARPLSGTVSHYDVTAAKKLLGGNVVKSNGTHYMVQYTDANQKPTAAELYRQFGDIRQAAVVSASKGTFYITEELFRKKGEPAFDIDSAAVFALDSPACLALRLVPGVKHTLVDALAYPAFEVTKVEPTTIGTEKVIKISYRVSKEKNDATTDKIFGLTEGWVAIRPDHQYTVLQAQYSVPGARRQPARTWKAEYVYDAAPGFPLLKEIKLATVDQTDKGDLKLAKQLYEVNFKPAKDLTDKDFSLTQFGLKEHTPTEWMAEVAAREKAEAEEQAKIAALPPGALKPVSAGLGIDPWVMLIGGVAFVVLLVIWVFWVTSRSKRNATSA